MKGAELVKTKILAVFVDNPGDLSTNCVPEKEII